MQRRLKRYHYWHAVWFLAVLHIAIAACAFFHSAYGAERADFLIVENAAGLNVFDRYEQQLSAKKRAALIKWAQFQIVEQKTILGDGITEAMHVRLGTRDYYFLYDSTGNLIGKSESGKITRFRQCTLIDEEATVSRDNSLYLQAGGRRIAMPKGVLIAKVFAHGARTYCMQKGAKEAYGWCAGSMSSLARKIDKSKQEQGAIPSDIARRITRRLENANESYRQYFGYFNSTTSKDKTAPRWLIENTADTFRATLKAGAGIKLKESTKILVRELEAMVYSEGLEVVHEDNVIEVVEREE